MSIKKGHFISIFFVLIIGAAHAQPSAKRFIDCGTLQSTLFTAGDTVLIQCDTVYVLNKLTFRQFDGAYRDLRKKGTSIANLMNAYDEILNLQENRLREQAESYDQLRANFLSLSSEAQTKINESSLRLTAALSSLDNLNKDLVETNKLLGEAKEIIQAEKSWLNLERLSWGLGGVAVGAILGVILTN